MRATANSDYRKHTSPLFAKLDILDIFQVSGLQIAKFMFYYHKQLLPPMFLSLFCTSSQIHSYEARTAKSYRPHHFRTNLKQFTILYQGPKIWSSLSVSITGSTSFPTFKKKMIWVWIDVASLSHPIYQHISNRGGLHYKPGGFLEVSSTSRIFFMFYFNLKWLINDELVSLWVSLRVHWMSHSWVSFQTLVGY